MRVPGWLVAFAAVFSTVGMGVLDAVWSERRRRRRVKAAVEKAVAQNIDRLVPEQRESPDPVWWEFVPRQRDGGDR